ncbi:hypothetical protein B0H10DRAFT_2192107 [Mycena sp. CBHHK59/15]|nr:hypothetical protein B0H10DRAFT_2192107 [Mycena sp. CBHHK59/15]
MPALLTMKAKSWLDYLNQPLEPCRYKQSNYLEVPMGTHTAGKTTMLVCGLGTDLTASQAIIDRITTGHIDRLIRTSGLIIPEDQHTQPLLNEQSVAEMYFSNVLVPVKSALDTMFAPLLEKAATTTDVFIWCDHYLVLEHLHKINGALVVPPLRITWQSPEEFKQALKLRVTSKPGQEVPYLRLVLCVIEEKKPLVIVPKCFTPNYYLKDEVGYNNVGEFLPQLKKYSIDGKCPLVVLTDYIHTMMLNVVEAGARYDNEERIVRTDNVGRALVEYQRLDLPRRYVLFCAAVRRLEEAGLLKHDRDRGLVVV